MAHDSFTVDAKWDALHKVLTDTLVVSDLPETSMTCAALRALLDVLSIRMTREAAKSLIAQCLDAFGESTH